jgi:hypothetical protein
MKFKRCKAVSVGIKPIWAPGVLVELLRELASGGFTWAESTPFIYTKSDLGEIAR